MKRLGLVVAVLLAVVAGVYAVDIDHTFTPTAVPQRGLVYMKDVDFTTTQNIDVNLPNNHKYVVEGVYVRSSAVTTLSAGAVVAINEVTSAGAAVQTVMPAVTLPSTDATGDMHDLGPLTEGQDVPGFVSLRDVATAGTDQLHAQVAGLTNTATVAITSGITNPATPRNLVITFTDAASDDLAGTVTVVGTDWSGRAVTEATTIVTGTVSYVGSQVFRTVTSVSRAMGATGAAGDTMDLGYGVKLGLPFNPETQGGLAVDKVEVYTSASTIALTESTAAVTNFALLSTTITNYTYSGDTITNFALLSTTITNYTYSGSTITNYTYSSSTITTVVDTATNTYSVIISTPVTTNSYTVWPSTATATNTYVIYTNAAATAVSVLTSTATATNAYVIYTNVAGTAVSVWTNATAAATVGTRAYEAAGAVDTTYGSFTATTAPNAARSYGVYYSLTGPARADGIDGSNLLRFGITGSTATNDTKDVIMRVLAY